MSENCSGNCDSCKSGCNSNNKLNEKMATIKHKLFVLSGKGGVGKSTVSAALAVSLAQKGLKVGLLDVDFHGPSQPTLFKQQNTRMSGIEELGLMPVETAGIKLVSIGLLLDNADDAIIWRGPAKMGIIKQLLEECVFGDLDYLVCDFPPGTGDEILSACQLVPGDKSAIIVTTPQEMSLADCRKCLDFCRQLELPVLGVVENMSYFICPDCKSRHYLFSNGGGAKLAAAHSIRLLGSLPMDPDFLQKCDQGEIAKGLEKSEVGSAFAVIADEIVAAKEN